MDEWKTYSEWVEQVPKWMKDDPLWGFVTYRKTLFFSDLAWRDCETLRRHYIARHLISQLIKSGGSPSANVEEGYGRGYGKDYARFLRIALGSMREARGWYFRNRKALPSEVVEHRIKVATECIKLLTIAANQQRQK